jgi:hypothetical protein
MKNAMVDFPQTNRHVMMGQPVVSIAAQVCAVSIERVISDEAVVHPGVGRHGPHGNDQHEKRHGGLSADESARHDHPPRSIGPSWGPDGGTHDRRASPPPEPLVICAAIPFA